MDVCLRLAGDAVGAGWDRRVFGDRSDRAPATASGGRADRAQHSQEGPLEVAKREPLATC